MNRSMLKQLEELEKRYGTEQASETKRGPRIIQMVGFGDDRPVTGIRADLGGVTFHAPGSVNEATDLLLAIQERVDGTRRVTLAFDDHSDDEGGAMLSRRPDGVSLAAHAESELDRLVPDWRDRYANRAA